MHTWLTPHADPPTAGKDPPTAGKDPPKGYDRYGFKEIVVEDQAPLLKEINDTLGEYWYEDVYRKHGNSIHEWDPQMLKNGLYGMTSMKRVTEMCSNSGIPYDYVIYIRPECRFYSNISTQFLDMGDDSIVCPKEQWGGKELFGINDVWTIVPFAKVKAYGYRIDEAKYYRKNIGRIAGEHYVGWIVQKYFSVVLYSDVHFDLCR
jgi:hypothetical protein